MINHWPQISRPLEGDVLRVISHGGGVQTSVLCLMAARGEIGPMPDLAIMADTGDEMQRTYDYLNWLRDKVPFPVVLIKRPGPSLGEATLEVIRGERPRKGTQLPPLFTDDGRDRGMLPKQCSKEYKTRVVAREVARLIGLRPGQRGPAEPAVEMWIGMTKDEMWRVKTNEKKWIHNRHPLVELDLHRSDCIRWAEDRQYRLPQKSSCRYCPFRDAQSWKDMAAQEPEEFELACRFDDAVRPGWPGMDGHLAVHRSGMPLRDAIWLDDAQGDLDLPPGSDCDSCGI